MATFQSACPPSLVGSLAALARSLPGLRGRLAVLDAARASLASAFPGACVTWVEATGPSASTAGPFVLRDPEPGSGPRVELVLPVRVSGAPRAVFVATSSDASAFDDAPLALLGAWADVVGAAVAAAGIFESVERDRARLRLVAEVARHASASLAPDELFERVLEILLRRPHHELAGIGIVDRDTGTLVPRAVVMRRQGRDTVACHTPLTAGITGAVASTGLPALVRDVTRDPRYVEVDGSVRAEICVPIRIAGAVVGVLDVESSQPDAFDESDLVALSSVADHLAVALHDARLFEEVRRANAGLAERERAHEAALATLAHDVRTPVACFRAAAEILVSYGDAPSDLPRGLLESLAEEAARLGRQVEDLLAHARHEAGIPVEADTFDVSEQLGHLARVFSREASRRGLSFACELPDAVPDVVAPRGEVARVVSELVALAFDATPPGGTVTLSAHGAPADPGRAPGRVIVDVDQAPAPENSRERPSFQHAAPRLRGGGSDPARRLDVRLGRIAGRLWEAERPGHLVRRLSLPARPRT